MRTIAFSKRTALEVLRDPLNVVFGLGFPIVLLILLSAIQANVPVELFAINTLAPGMTVFGLSFITLFSATLISKDSESALFARLMTTPLTAVDFIIGYTVPLLPLALAQSAVCYAFSLILNLQFGVWILIAILFNIPTAIVFISIGLLCGSILNSKQVGGICGALLTNLTAWFSGIWFDLDLVGGAFKKVAELLPFYHAVELQRCIAASDLAQGAEHLLWVTGYAVLMLVLSIVVFIKRRKAM